MKDGAMVQIPVDEFLKLLDEAGVTLPDELAEAIERHPSNYPPTEDGSA
jgi:hypothetical protein